MSSAHDVLQARYGKVLADAIIDAYSEIESNFALNKWKVSELDAGHFVEATRRALEQELFGKATPIGTKLANFDDQVLRAYEQAQGDESHRMLIPRALKAVFNIRNKRGVGHLGGISPNEMDATYILYSCKWVLAELTRLASGLSPQETQRLLDEIVEREIALVWSVGDVTRILDPRMSARDQTLVLLYHQSPQSDVELARAVEYSRLSDFRKVLRALHKQRLIELLGDGRCVILPPGVLAGEQVILKARARRGG